MNFKNQRFITKGVDAGVCLLLQHFMWSCIDNLPPPRDYLQVFALSNENGREFTNAYLTDNKGKLSLFEKALKTLDIKYHRIRVATPRHNGKVERQHRTDEKRLYKKMKMYNLADGRKQLERYNQKSSNIPKICLDFLTPNEVMEKYLSVM